MEHLDQINTSELSMMPSAKKKHWEHSWTVEEMKKAAEHWTLASDVGMFLHLQEFSQKLLLQTHEIQEQVDSLNHDAKLTNIRLHNVFNDFVMLANTQFMENRVYDEEVVGQEQTDGNKKAEEKEKTQQQKEMELIPKIKQAISLGLNVFDTAYEKLDMNISNSESEDEDTTTKSNIILEPKDPYLHRPLPCLIGSEQFYQTDSLGLSYLMVEETEDQESDRPSESDLRSPTKPLPLQKQETRIEDDSDESDDDLFTEIKPKRDVRKTKGEDVEEEEEEMEEEEEEEEISFKYDDNNAVKNPMNDLQSELARKFGDSTSIVHQPKHPNQEPPSAKPRANKLKQQPPENEGDLFGACPEEPGDDIFSRPGRLFSSRPTLFDDNEDNDEGSGLFSAQQKEEKRYIPPKAVQKEFEGKRTSTPESARKTNKKEQQATKGRNLFEEEDKDEDLFMKKPITAAKQTKAMQRPGASLFDDDDDDERDDSDIFSSESKPERNHDSSKSTETKSNKPKIPAGAVSIFGGGDSLFKAVLQKAKKDDDDDYMDEATVNDKLLTKPSAVAKSLKTTGSTDALKPSPGSSSPSTMSSSSLFAEDPELFTAMPKSKLDMNKEPCQQTMKSGKSGGLILFAADDEDDDLFASVAKPSTAERTKGFSKEPEIKKKVEKILFDDEEDDDDGDLFAIPKSSTSKDEKKNITLIDEIPSQKPISATKEIERKGEIKEPVKETKPRTKKVSLFSSSDDEDDLFLTSSKKSPATVETFEKSSDEIFSKPIRTGRSLFDDDDFLFGSPNDGPSFDLFKPSVSTVDQTSSSAQTVTSVPSPSEIKPSSINAASEILKPPTSKAKGTQSKLFGSLEDEEDDLFSSQKTESLQKPQVGSKAVPNSKATVPLKSSVNEKQKDVLKEVDGKVNKHKKLASETPLVEDRATESMPRYFVDPLSSVIAEKKVESKKLEEIIVSSSQLPASSEVFGEADDFTREIDKVVGKEKSHPPTSPKVLPKVPAKGNRISQLQSSVNIDPASLLPQKIKKTDEEKAESAAIDFSLPAQAPTLHSLAKNRAKIPIKRRLPTRKHTEPRDVSTEGLQHEPDKKNSASESFSVLSNHKTVADSLKDDLFSAVGASTKAHTPSGAHGSDFMSSETAAVLPGNETSSRNLSNITSSKKSAISSDKEAFSLGQKSEMSLPGEGNLFDVSLKSDPLDSRNDASKTKLLNDANDHKPSNVLSKQTSSKFLAPDDDDDDDDDIFGRSSLSKDLKTTVATKHTPSDVKPDRGGTVAAISLDEQDLFGRPSSLLSSAKNLKPKNKAEDNDNDELFSTNILQSTGKASTNSKNLISSSKPSEIVFPSDEDSIFGGPGKSFSVKDKPISHVSKSSKDDAADDDEDIFRSSRHTLRDASKAPDSTPRVLIPVDDDDDDDIFAHVPPVSSKPKKPSSQAQERKEQISGENDLFGSSSLSTSNRRPAYKKPITKDEDLFHDDTDIFADITSTKSKEKKPQEKNIKPTTAKASEDESDDIFSEAALSGKLKKVSSQALKPATSLSKHNDDYDDIFEDPLNALRK